MKHLPQTFPNWEQRRIERELNFIRPLFFGYDTPLDWAVCKMERSDVISLFPRKCAFSGKLLFMKRAVRVKKIDNIWRNTRTIRWYDPQEFMIMAFKL